MMSGETTHAFDIGSAIAFAERCQVAYVATCANGQPYVRPMQLVTGGGEGFYFVTGSNKTVCRQLRINPCVEMCFREDMSVMRVRGEIAWVKDTAWLICAMHETPWAPKREIIERIRPDFEFFSLPSGVIRWWSDASTSLDAEVSF